MLAAFVTVGLLAVAVTGVMNSFSDGETLTAGKLNTNFQTLKTAIESVNTKIDNIPNWTKNGTTAVYNDGNVTINGTISSSVLGVFCGATSGSYDGAQVGGFIGAKNKCVTTCGNVNAHMCTGHEVSITLQLGMSFPTPSIGNQYWVSAPMYSASTTTLECRGWTSNNGSEQGSAIYVVGTVQAFTGICNNSYQIACCL
ncbi:MAG: hypothetical protein KA146_04390 [Leptospiraceae bacterium]|nr:hypothetical protein [Leptospiraceae bacterium]